MIVVVIMMRTHEAGLISFCSIRDNSFDYRMGTIMGTRAIEAWDFTTVYRII